MKRCLLFPVLIQFVLVSTTFAQWQVDGFKMGSPAFGVGPVSDGAGGVLLAWRNGTVNPDVYVQRLDPAGNALWTPNGVLVCNAPGGQFRPRVASDGAGGAIVAWVDERNGSGSNQQIFAQRVNAAGLPQWTANGVPVSGQAPVNVNVEIISDTFGGAIIAWCDKRNGNFDVFAQRLNSSGTALWTANGTPVCTDPSDQVQLKTAANIPGAPFTGGALLCWVDERIPSGIYAQSITAQGVAVWTANGVRIDFNSSLFDYPAITNDGGGGAIVAWIAPGDDVYVQKINYFGFPSWSPGGIPVCTAVDSQSQVTLSPTAGGGAVLVWSDWRSGNPAVYTQRVSDTGQPLWTIDGVLVSGELIAEGHQAIISSPAGTYVVWSHGTDHVDGLDADIYAQKLDAAGATQWNPGGVVVCAKMGPQTNPGLVLDGSGGFIATWLDNTGAGISHDAYAERVSATGESYAFVVTKTADDDTPGSLRAAIRQANATPGLQTISFNIPGGGVQTIAPVSALPVVTDALTIDGFTQPGAYPNTTPVGTPSDAQIMIELDGSQFGSPRGFQFAASDCALRGVAMFGCYIPVTVSGPNAVIEGNYLGFRADGQPFPSNPGDGVIVMGSNCRVGGASAAARNVIGGLRSGVYVYGVSGPQIYGNYIGISPDLATAQQNSVGVWLINTSGTRIGSSVVTLAPNRQEANIIANDLDGVDMEGTGTVNNMVIGNSFFGTSYSAIDLGLDGPTYNDRNDADSGPNNLENQPDISSISATQINGSMLQRVLNVPVYVHLYASSSCGGSAGRGNAVTYLGGVVLGAIDNFFSFPLAQPLAPGTRITSTATDLNGNTSELSTCVEYQNTGSGSNVVVSLTDGSGNVRGTATYGNVTGSGNTFLTNPYTPPVPVSGYAIGNPNDPQIYFNITTNASYTGGVDVCLNYDETHIPGPEANLVLLHYDGSMWANVTTSRDLVNNRVCGHVTSLSPFVIGAVSTTGVGDTPLPTQFALHANVPNPFNPITTISYDIPSGGADVNISVFDISGRLVRELLHEHRPAGVSSVQWNGEDDRGARVASGVYFYRMRAGDFVETKKMVLLK